MINKAKTILAALAITAAGVASAADIKELGASLISL